MKKILLLFILISGSAFSQMPNIEQVWTNNNKLYTGTIDLGKEGKKELKLKVKISEQNKKNDQEYFLSGYDFYNNAYQPYEGKITIKKYKDAKKRGSVFGEYELAERGTGAESGIFKGKFIYTFKWNPKTEKIEEQYVELVGTWKSYDGTKEYNTILKNQQF